MTPVEVVAITPAHLERAPWHPMPSCRQFGLSRVVYPPRARWLMTLGADGHLGPLVQFLPLLALYPSVDLEFGVNE